jgi:hypothetical protein
MQVGEPPVYPFLLSVVSAKFCAPEIPTPGAERRAFGITLCTSAESSK